MTNHDLVFTHCIKLHSLTVSDILIRSYLSDKYWLFVAFSIFFTNKLWEHVAVASVVFPSTTKVDVSSSYQVQMCTEGQRQKIQRIHCCGTCTDSHDVPAIDHTVGSSLKNNVWETKSVTGNHTQSTCMFTTFIYWNIRHKNHITLWFSVQLLPSFTLNTYHI